jgi:prevent-host-death family protein
VRQQDKPATETMKVTDARAKFSQILNLVYRGERRIVVEKDGIPVAAIVSAADLGELRELEERRAADFAILDQIGDAFKDEAPDTIEREVARALAAVRRRRRGKPISPRA